MAGRIKKRIFQGIILAVILAGVYYPGYRRVQEARMKNCALQQRLESLREDNFLLQKKLEKLEHDMVYIEERAREEMGIVGEGEIIYEFVPLPE